MPPSARKSQRTKRDARGARKDLPSLRDDGIDSSPSRPSKRRKHIAPAETEPADSDQLVTQVTQQLKSQPIQASKDHANAIHEANGDGVKAYAKVAAQDWTFYITKLAINIGRAPETTHDNEAHDPVHIDLGPSKIVSREHASICFDSQEERWILHVKGRNGAKVDGEPVEAGRSHTLSSGEVMEIGNVEMMFVLPTEISELKIHRSFLQRTGLQVNSSQQIERTTTSTRRPLAAMPSTDATRPGTPPSSRTPMPMSALKSPAVSTPAVMVGAHGADLSLDENQHIKPQYSYAQMITQAITSSPEGKLNLNGIYTHIMNNYAYYRHQQAAGWQNSIRHNLSLNKAFDKVARSTDEPGKGMKWQVVPEAREEMLRNAFRIGRGGHRGSSAPSSPSGLNYITHGPRDIAARDSPTARKLRGSPPTSPPSRAPPTNLHLTPGRPSARSSRSTALTADGSPLPRPKRNHGDAGSGHNTSNNSAGVDASFSSFNPQSPTLTSSYLQDDSASFVTPAPPRVHPRLAPPSTIQRPSQHMPTSSPAPFWKYADIGSTPLKPLTQYEITPSKPNGSMSHGGVGGADGRIAVGSSSPPPPMTRGRHNSPPSSPIRVQNAGAEAVDDDETNGEAGEDGGEEQVFDLTKGFQSIGAYHAPIGVGRSIANAMRG